jgi:hypothetical protein
MDGIFLRRNYNSGLIFLINLFIMFIYFTPLLGFSIRGLFWTPQFSVLENVLFLMVYYFSMLPLTMAVFRKYKTIMLLYLIYFLLNFSLFFYQDHYMHQQQANQGINIGLILLTIFLDVLVAPILLIFAFLFDSRKRKRLNNSIEKN